MDNLILHLGRNTSIGQRSQFIISALRTIIGALDDANAHFVCEHLFNRHYITGPSFSVTNGKTSFIGLSAEGWERFYELEKGIVEQHLAFMAMPFNNPGLDKVYLNWFKPACKTIGFDLRRVDEKPEAGLINNKMMVDIRKSRFVIAELTYENRGVYWEGFCRRIKQASNLYL